MQKIKLKKTIPKNKYLKIIPSVQEILVSLSNKKIDIDDFYLKMLVQSSIQEYRNLILNDKFSENLSQQHLRKSIIRTVNSKIKKFKSFKLKRVINGTGIILHTNLGRAPIAVLARKHLAQIIENYCNLEIDLNSGKRGNRIALVEEIICLITGAEAAVVVNNNAGAILLVLHSLCRRKEVPVSRGELVEIGGSFRMPEVMKVSGVKMVEVGTTNKTHLKDYVEVITKKTAGILKVHTSNYKVLGFTKRVTTEDLVKLAHGHKLPLIYDMGSGVIEDLEKWGYSHEPVARDNIRAGVDVVTFSADKMLGGPQAGIIIGKKRYIDIIRKNHLLRALRCDKMTFALLDATLRLYLQPKKLSFCLPVAEMLNLTTDTLQKRGKIFLENIDNPILKVKLQDTFSQMGSGALPLEKIPSVALVISPKRISVNTLSKKMRLNNPAIVGYIENKCYLLNLRTIRDDEIPMVVKALNSVKN